MQMLLSQEERKEFEKKADDITPNCPCGKRGIGSWGLQIGYGDPFQFTHPLPYCLEHLDDLIYGLELSINGLRKIKLEELARRER